MAWPPDIPLQTLHMGLERGCWLVGVRGGMVSSVSVQSKSNSWVSQPLDLELSAAFIVHPWCL